jgi:hypothetical protein
MMRKFFAIFGMVAAVVLVGIAIGLFILVRNSSALSAEGRTYVDAAIVSIIGHWDERELLKRATPHLRETTKPDDMQRLFAAAALGLGPLVDYGGATGDAQITTMVGSGTRISATYVAKAKFERGDAAIRIFLLRIDGAWMIEGFNIDSPAMIRNLAGQRA